MNLRMIRIGLWVAVGLAAVAGIFIALRPPAALPPPIQQPMTNVGGPFTLVGSDGRSFSSTQLKGKPFAIFFGFTHCPDVCPTTLARLAKLRRALGKGDDSFAILFVSVDPERDTPAEMGRYAALFGSPIVALSGSASQINQVKRSFGIYSAKVPQADGGYSVDHSAATFLMDRNGAFIATITPDEGDPAAIAKLRRLMN